MSIIIAILIFSAIIILHELGHFIAARACGVKVNEFAFGMGPKLFSKQKGETVYSLRCFPIGGFCAMEGEDESSDSDTAFCSKKVWQRMIIVAAGPFMNLVLGFLLVAVLTVIGGSITSTQISWFEQNDKGEVIAKTHETGLEIGDKIVEMNGMHIWTDMDISYQLTSDKDGIFDMKVIRNGEKIALNGVEFAKDTVDNQNVVHIDFKVSPIKLNPLTVTSYSAKATASYARLIWISLSDLVSGKYKINDLSGPVGIVGAIDDVVGSQTEQPAINWSELISNILSMAAFLSINVGIFNLLPIPALDGGRLVFLIVEGIRRKPINREVEGYIHFAGLALFMILMVVITVSDVKKLF